MLESKDRMIWIDTETFGLNPQTDYLLEVGFKITDLQLQTRSTSSKSRSGRAESTTQLATCFQRTLKTSSFSRCIRAV